MDGQSKSFSKNKERGNAMVYVLLIVALFAALSFILARQTDNAEGGVVSEEQIEISASTIQQTTMQLKQSIEQMLWTGTAVSSLDFMTPDDGNFETGSPVNKVFHPHGGGLVIPRLQKDDTNQVSGNLSPGWYIGRVNDIEWTPRGPLGHHDCPLSPPDCDVAGEPACNAVCPPGCPDPDPAICPAYQDVILTAYQLKRQICARINEKLTGSDDIPVIAVPAPERLIYSSASDFTAADCPDCDGAPALCIEDSNGAYSFYSIMAAE